MVKIDSLEMKDGKIYRNLYFEDTKYDLENIFELEEEELDLFEKQDGTVKPFTVLIKDIKHLEVDNKTKYDFSFVTLCKENGTEQTGIIYSPEYEGYPYTEKIEFIGDQKYDEVKNFYIDYFHNCLKRYMLKDELDVVVCMIDVSINCLECVLDQFKMNKNDPDTIFSAGYEVGILMAVYVTVKLDADKDDPFMRGDHNKILKDFVKFVEKTQKDKK